jgi:hypothetical protein
MLYNINGHDGEGKFGFLQEEVSLGMQLSARKGSYLKAMAGSGK